MRDSALCFKQDFLGCAAAARLSTVAVVQCSVAQRRNIFWSDGCFSLNVCSRMKLERGGGSSCAASPPASSTLGAACTHPPMRLRSKSVLQRVSYGRQRRSEVGGLLSPWRRAKASKFVKGGAERTSKKVKERTCAVLKCFSVVGWWASCFVRPLRAVKLNNYDPVRIGCLWTPV